MLIPIISTQATVVVIVKESTVAVILKEQVKSILINKSCWSKWRKNKADRALVYLIMLEQSAFTGNI